jgi:hypothetical protein
MNSETIYRATSNLTWDGQDPERVHRPRDTREFPSLEAATDWLKAKRCGGSIHWHDGHEDRAFVVQAGI